MLCGSEGDILDAMFEDGEENTLDESTNKR